VTTTELNLPTWCLLRAERFRDFEQREMAMYPDGDSRDMAIVEWTIRCLANPQLADAREALALIAGQHGLELAEAGTTAALTKSREYSAGRDNEIGRLVAENARLRQQRDEALAEGRRQAAADVGHMPITLGDAGWEHLEAKAVEADYPAGMVRRRRTRDDFTTSTIEAAYQYGYRRAAKVARGEVAPR